MPVIAPRTRPGSGDAQEASIPFPTLSAFHYNPQVNALLELESLRSRSTPTTSQRNPDVPRRNDAGASQRLYWRIKKEHCMKHVTWAILFLTPVAIALQSSGGGAKDGQQVFRLNGGDV